MLVDELEEVFFERFMEPGEDEKNAQTAKALLDRYAPVVEELAQDLEDGLVIDFSQAALNVQMYLFAKKYAE